MILKLLLRTPFQSKLIILENGLLHPHLCLAMFSVEKHSLTNNWLHISTTTHRQLRWKRPIMHGSLFELRHNKMGFGIFWINCCQVYSYILRQAVYILLPFATTFYCETAFFSMTLIKTKQRSELEVVEQELKICLCDIKSRIKPI